MGLTSGLGISNRVMPKAVRMGITKEDGKACEVLVERPGCSQGVAS